MHRRRQPSTVCSVYCRRHGVDVSVRVLVRHLRAFVVRWSAVDRLVSDLSSVCHVPDGLVSVCSQRHVPGLDNVGTAHAGRGHF